MLKRLTQRVHWTGSTLFFIAKSVFHFHSFQYNRTRAFTYNSLI